MPLKKVSDQRVIDLIEAIDFGEDTEIEPDELQSVLLELIELRAQKRVFRASCKCH